MSRLRKELVLEGGGGDGWRKLDKESNKGGCWWGWRWLEEDGGGFRIELVLI